MIKLVRGLAIALSGLLAGCTLFIQDLQALHEGQLRQQQQLEQQRQLLEQQSRDLALLANNSVPLTAAPAVSAEAPQVVDTEGKLLLGRVEWVWINSMEQPLKARVDTGASTSSLNAQQLQPFERDGQRWVRFRLPLDSAKGSQLLEAPLQRYTRIRQSSSETMERRPVVLFKLQVGNLIQEAEFTLSDRAGMLYPVLLGREFLQDIAIVDVARKFVQPKPLSATKPEAR